MARKIPMLMIDEKLISIWTVRATLQRIKLCSVGYATLPGFRTFVRAPFVPTTLTVKAEHLALSAFDVSKIHALGPTPPLCLCFNHVR